MRRSFVWLITPKNLPVTVLFGVWLAISITYLLPIFSASTVSMFAYHYGDLVLLSALIPLMCQRVCTSKHHSIERLFWLLLSGAIVSWWLLTVVYNLYWSSLSTPIKNLSSGLAYFLFYALMIAATELRGYQQPRQLLSLHSSVIWLASLTFVLGSFIYLIVIPATKISYNLHELSTTYFFYLLLDGYLVCRWVQLAINHRRVDWHGYALFAASMIMWFVSDAQELYQLHRQGPVTTGGLSDWLSYIPYALFAGAIYFGFDTLDQSSRRSEPLRLHLLNSPLLLTMLTAFVFVIASQIEQPYSFDSTDHTRVFAVWMVVLSLLSLLQHQLFKHERLRLNNQLREAQYAKNNLHQQLERKTQQIKLQRDTYRAIIETTTNSIFTVAPDGAILSANQAAIRLLEYDYERLLTLKIQDLVPENDELHMYFTFKSYRQKLERNGRSIDVESTFLDATGVPFLVHVTLSLGKIDDSAPIVITLSDISEQKKAEQEIIRMKDEFTANISHEFRTPLTIINGVLDNLKDTVHEPSLLKQIDSAKTNGLRMVKMVEQLLELSKSGRENVLLSSIDATAICQFIADSFSTIASQKNIEFTFKADRSCWVTGNIQALEKIVFNLLSNAFKYTAPDGRVELMLIASDKSTDLIVQDNGPGIPLEEQPRVFERFYRTKQTDNKPIHGVGIGLSLVKDLCRRMGWDIALKSTSRGSKFTIIMPTAEASRHGEKPSLPTSPIERNIESILVDVQSQQEVIDVNKSSYLVLIIEDNLDMQQHLSSIINKEHQCLVASNGEDGIKMALEYLPDIIVSDVMMPKMNGFEALKIIRRRELTAHIPVILLTARSDTASKIEGLEATADDYLAKPFDARELILRINNTIQSRLKLTTRLRQQWNTSSPHKNNEPEKVTDKFLLRLYDCFERTYQDTNLSMTAVASTLAVSERQLQRKIRALLNLSPLDALRRFRIQKAQGLLSKQIQIGLVAQQVGFSSQSHFGRLFKEQIGMTPSEYQKKTTSQ